MLKGQATLKIFRGSVFGQLAQTIIKQGLKRVGFEERHLPFAEYKKIKSLLKGRALLVPTYGVVEGLREVKTPEEISNIRKALTLLPQQFISLKIFCNQALKS